MSTRENIRLIARALILNLKNKIKIQIINNNNISKTWYQNNTENPFQFPG